MKGQSSERDEVRSSREPSRHRPEFGLYMFGIDWEWQDLKSAAQAADQGGFDAIWMMDNVYGPTPMAETRPVFDTWTALPALAAVTERVRLGPMVSPVNRRNPALLAKSAAVLDRISDGRLEIGIGPGDLERQFTDWDLPFPPIRERIQLVREQIEAMRLLWTKDRVDFEGEQCRLSGAICSPKPIQQPGPPIWVGVAAGRKVMPKVAAEFGDGVNIHAAPDHEVSEVIDLVRNSCESLGRDFGQMRTSQMVGICLTGDAVEDSAMREGQERAMDLEPGAMREYWDEREHLIIGPPEHCAERLQARFELGVDHLMLCFYSVGEADEPRGLAPDSMVENIRRFVNDVMPRFA